MTTNMSSPVEVFLDENMDGSNFEVIELDNQKYAVKHIGGVEVIIDLSDKKDVKAWIKSLDDPRNSIAIGLKPNAKGSYDVSSFHNQTVAKDGFSLLNHRGSIVTEDSPDINGEIDKKMSIVYTEDSAPSDLKQTVLYTDGKFADNTDEDIKYKLVKVAKTALTTGDVISQDVAQPNIGFCEGAAYLRYLGCRTNKRTEGRNCKC